MGGVGSGSEGRVSECNETQAPVKAGNLIDPEKRCQQVRLSSTAGSHWQSQTTPDSLRQAEWIRCLGLSIFFLLTFVGSMEKT